MRSSRSWAGRLVAAAIAGCATAGLLGGCAAPQPPAVAAANAVTLAGRLSLVSGVDGAQKALYGGFSLVLQGQDGRFEVFSPLGQMLARARWSPGEAILDDGRQRRQYTSFEDLTAAALGVALPQAALQDWVRGRPAADLPAERVPGGGFDQLGWEVRPTWRDGRLTLLVARRIEGEPAELRMVIEAESGRPPAPAAGASPAAAASVGP